MKLFRYFREQPVSVALIVIIWVLCLLPGKEFPRVDFSLADKWAHFLMYGTLCFAINIEYLRRKKKACWKNLFIGAFMLPVIMGGMVELAQAYCTGGSRSGDWLDFLANSIGVIIGCLAAIPFFIKKKDFC